MAHTATWNAAYEADPADGDDVGDGATEIREFKRDIRERVAKDHYMSIAGTDADHGEHAKITFQAQYAAGSPGADKAFLYTTDVNSKAELHFKDEDDNVMQLTSAGRILGALITDDSIDSDHYVDGSIDQVHLAADIIDGTKIEDTAVDSEHIVAGAIDTTHIAALNITTALIANLNVTEGKLAASAVGQAKLKTSTQEVSTVSTGGANLSLSSVGSYGFYPQLKVSNGITTCTWLNVTTVSTSYVTVIRLSSSNGAHTAYANMRYVTASGEVFWVFFLTSRKTRQIIASSAGPDHPCLGNGGKPKLHPHPFVDYDPALHEVVLVNPSKEQLKEMRGRRDVDADDIPDRSLLQVINEDYELDFTGKPKWPEVPVTVKINNASWDNPEAAEVIKKVIPENKSIKLAKLRLKRA